MAVISCIICHLLIGLRSARSVCGTCSSPIGLIGILVLSSSLFVHRDSQSLSQLGIILKVDSKLADSASTSATTKDISHHTIGAISCSCRSSCAIVITLEYRRREEHVSDHGNTHRNIQKVAIVVLVCSVNQSLQLGNIVWIGKVDYINGDIVLSESFA